MARRRRSRGRISLFDLFSDLVDDVKDFVDDDLLDRGRDTERDVRRAGRNWFEAYDDYDSRLRNREDDEYDNRRRRSRRRYQDDDLDELRDAISRLTRNVQELVENASTKPA